MTALASHYAPDPDAMTDRERHLLAADRAKFMATLVQYDLYPVWE